MMPSFLETAIQQVMPMAIATGLFDVATCTVQQPDGLRGPSGAPSGDFVNVAGLVDIPVMGAPVSVKRVKSDETKADGEVLTKSPRWVDLNGYYPAAITGQRIGWRVIVTSGPLVTIYDLESAEPDSQNTQTRLYVTEVNV